VQFSGSDGIARSPLWHISMDDHVPCEFMAAVATTLSATARDDPASLLNEGSAWVSVPSGWRALGTPGIVAGARTADGEASYHFDPHAAPAGLPIEYGPAWKFTACESGKARWTARFSASTPPVLIEAFHRVFTDPSPLPRALYQLDAWERDHLTADVRVPLTRWSAARDRQRGQSQGEGPGPRPDPGRSPQPPARATSCKR